MSGPTNGHAAGVSLEIAAPLNMTKDTGIADSLSPSQVRSFMDCGYRWFNKTLLGLPDPPTSNLAVGTSVHAVAEANAKYKLETKQDLDTEGAVAIFRNSWGEQQELATFRDDENPREIGLEGEALVRIYMSEVAPKIQPAAVELPVKGVIGGVRINARLDLIDVAGKITDVKTAAATPSSIDPMYRFAVATYARLAPGASGEVQLNTLVKIKTPKNHPQAFKIDEADNRMLDTVYPLTQQAMRSGYYVPNRLSLLCSRRHCAFWRRCEKEFGGTVDES
jgi:RecB family exonuclease